MMSRLLVTVGIVVLLSDAFAQQQSYHSYTFYAIGALPVGNMNDGSTVGYGAGIRYEWGAPRALRYSLSGAYIHLEKREKFRQDTIPGFGGEPLTVAVPIEIGASYTIGHGSLAPVFFIEGGFIFSNGSRSDVVGPGIGIVLGPGYGHASTSGRKHLPLQSFSCGYWCE